jgi:hypothetical protein
MFKSNHFSSQKLICLVLKRSYKKRQPTKWKKIFLYHLSVKGLISRVCKELSSKQRARHAVGELLGG